MTDNLDNPLEELGKALEKASESIDLNNEFNSEELYNNIKDSDHWEDQGYKLADSDTRYEEDTDKVERYHAQFCKLGGENRWVHVRVPGGTTDSIRYLVTMGDEDTIRDDLEEAVYQALDEMD